MFDGNRADVTTLKEIVDLMENKYGKARRVWVFDRGMVSEENMDELRERGIRYVVETPKRMLKKFEAELGEKDWIEAEPGVEVKMVANPDYGTEKFILCRSRQREQKEQAILDKQTQKLVKKLKQIQASIHKGRLKTVSVADRWIGQWLGKYSRAEKLFDVHLIVKDGLLRDIVIKRRKGNEEWAKLSQGYYLLRTNLEEENPQTLWKIYI